MNKFSKLNRQIAQGRADCTELDNWAAMILKENTVDMVLCGHDHVPRIRNYDGGTYMNAGSFYNHRSLIIYNKGNFALVTWDNKGRKFIPFQPLTMQYE